MKNVWSWLHLFCHNTLVLQTDDILKTKAELRNAIATFGYIYNKNNKPKTDEQETLRDSTKAAQYVSHGWKSMAWTTVKRGLSLKLKEKGFFCGWSAGVEFVARLPERPGSQQRHVLQAPKDVSVCGVLIHVQRIRGFTTIRYINPRFTYSLTYLMLSDMCKMVTMWSRDMWTELTE